MFYIEFKIFWQICEYLYVLPAQQACCECLLGLCRTCKRGLTDA